MVELHIVVEPVVDRRADAELHVSVQINERRGHDMRRGVAQQRERFGRFVGKDRHFVAVGDFAGKVDLHPVDDAAERGFRKPCANRCRYIGHRGAILQFFGRSIWQYNVHVLILSAGRGQSACFLPGAYKAPARFPCEKRTRPL